MYAYSLVYVANVYKKKKKKRFKKATRNRGHAHSLSYITSPYSYFCDKCFFFFSLFLFFSFLNNKPLPNYTK